MALETNITKMLAALLLFQICSSFLSGCQSRTVSTLSMGDENNNRNTLRFSSDLANVAEKNPVGKTGQVEQVFKLIQSTVSADIVKKTNAMYVFRLRLGDEYTN